MKQAVEPIQSTAVYKAEEAAELLRIDRSAVYKAYNSGELKGKDMGKGLKFLGRELLQYAGTATPPGQEIKKSYRNSGGVPEQ